MDSLGFTYIPGFLTSSPTHIPLLLAHNPSYLFLSRSVTTSRHLFLSPSWCLLGCFLTRFRFLCLPCLPSSSPSESVLALRSVVFICLFPFPSFVGLPALDPCLECPGVNLSNNDVPLRRAGGGGGGRPRLPVLLGRKISLLWLLLVAALVANAPATIAFAKLSTDMPMLFTL